VKEFTPRAVVIDDEPLIADMQNIVAAASTISRYMRGVFHGSTRRHRVSVPVSMDPTWDGNATGTVDIRDLSALT
jgi:hypothetical protein